MGRQLKRVFQEAGFADIQVGAEFESFAPAEDVAFFRRFAIQWFCSEETVEASVHPGVAERQQFEGCRRTLDRWKEEPGATAAMGWGYGLARKP